MKNLFRENIIRLSCFALALGIPITAYARPAGVNYIFELEPAQAIDIGEGAYGPTALTIGDIDADGDKDIAVANHYSGEAASVSLLSNEGSRNFDVADQFGAGFGAVSLSLADTDINQTLDLVVLNQQSNDAAIFSNDGQGHFDLDALIPVGVDYPTSLTIRDAGPGSRPDIAVSSFAGIKIFPEAGNALPKNIPLNTMPYALSTADLNGDQQMDLASANAMGGVSALLHDPDAIWGFDVQSYPGGEEPLAIATAELSGDTHTDLVIADAMSDTVIILKNDGLGAFTAWGELEIGQGDPAVPNAVVCADLDGDGRNDIAVANRYENSVSVFLNRGNGTFSAAFHFEVGYQPYAIAAADLDGDNKIDLISADRGSDQLSVLWNASRRIVIGNPVYPMILRSR